MTDGEGLTTQAPLLAAGVGLKLGLNQLSCYSVPTRDQTWVLQNGSRQPESSPQSDNILFGLQGVFLNLEMSPKKYRFQAFLNQKKKKADDDLANNIGHIPEW